MAELRFRILGDLSKLKSDLQKLFKEKFKIGVEGKGGGEGKKQTGMLGLIFKRLLPVGLLFSLKPIADSVKILTGFAVIGFLKIIKLLKAIVDFFPKAKEPTTVEQEVADAIAESTNRITGVLEPQAEKALTEAVKLQEILEKVGIDTNNGLIQNANIIRAALEAQGIDTKTFSDEFLLKLGDNSRENIAALDIISGGVSDLEKAIGGVSEPIEIAVEKEIDELTKDLEESDRVTSKDIISGAERISVDEIKVLEDQSEKLDSLPERIWGFVKQLAGLIASKIKGFFSFGRKTTTVDDAIIKPNGQVIKTNPQDTIIATKNPEGLGGGNKTFIFNGVTPQQVIDVIKRELGVDVIRSSRF